MYIRQNTVEQKDSLFRYQSSGLQSSFISIESTIEKINKINAKNTVLSISFYKDPKFINYERTVFSMLDCWGLIGGVNEILGLLGKLVVSLFSSKIFYFSIISAFYQVDLTSSIDKKETVKTSGNSKIRKSKTQKDKIANSNKISVYLIFTKLIYLLLSFLLKAYQLILNKETEKGGIKQI